MQDKFYKKSWFIILMLLILAPLGIFLMFKYTTWNKNFKIAASIVSATIFLIILFVPSDDSADKTNSQEALDNTNKATETSVDNTIDATNESTPTPEPVVLVSYEIVQKEDVSFSNVKRYDWYVVVNEPATKEQLKELAKYITEQAMNSIEFNALSIGFYDYQEYIGNSTYVLGNAIFAPDGDWSRADTVKAGDYESMYLNTSSLKEKDWTLRLSQDEVDIYTAWNKLYYEKDALIDKNTTEIVDEDEVDEEVAKQLNMSKEEVADIIWKQVIWVMDDVS